MGAETQDVYLDTERSGYVVSLNTNCEWEQLSTNLALSFRAKFNQLCVLCRKKTEIHCSLLLSNMSINHMHA